jgi:hypothetical protein
MEERFRTVPLIQAVKEHSTGSLAKAKADVGRLLDGGTVTLDFASEHQMDEFKRKAKEFGVVFG